MADALGVEIQRSPNGFGGTGLPGMSGQAHAMIPSVGINAAKKFRRSFHFIPPDAYSDDMAILVVDCEFEDLLRLFHAEVTSRVENPKQRNAEITSSASAATLQAFEDGSEILLAKQADSDRDIDLGMQNVFFLEPLHQAMRNKLVIIRRAQVGAHFLEGHQEAGKIGVPVERFCFGERRGVAVALPEFEQGGRLNCALQMQVQLRLGKLTNKSAGRSGSNRGHNFRL